MVNYGKITKVTLEFEFATLILDGEDAKKWKSMADSQSVLARVHGIEFESLNWIVRPKAAAQKEKKAKKS